MLESKYQALLIQKIYNLFPDCLVLKNDTDYIQGIPDLTILWRDRWAMLEVKASATAPNQPNQAFFVDQVNRMSFAAFIHPGNEEETLNALQLAFSARRKSRLPERQ